jgi:hypothetical protein
VLLVVKTQRQISLILLTVSRSVNPLHIFDLAICFSPSVFELLEDACTGYRLTGVSTSNFAHLTFVNSYHAPAPARVTSFAVQSQLLNFCVFQLPLRLIRGFGAWFSLPCVLAVVSGHRTPYVIETGEEEKSLLASVAVRAWDVQDLVYVSDVQPGHRVIHAPCCIFPRIDCLTSRSTLAVA